MTSRPSATAALRRGSVLLLVALAAATAPAQPAGAAGALAGLDAIDVALEIGGPLDVGGSTEPELFAGDLRRHNQFRSSFLEGVGAKLESCGILWDQGAVDVASITVFGRREEVPGGKPHYVFMVQVEVHNTKLADRRGEPEAVALPPVIGLADEAGLERALIDTAVAVLAGELSNCDG